MLDPAILTAALTKVQRRRHQLPNEREGYTADEVAALSAWMNIQLQFMGKETRAQRRDRNRAAWNSGDRRQWGGDRRRRDPRRGWRNEGPVGWVKGEVPTGPELSDDTQSPDA